MGIVIFMTESSVVKQEPAPSRPSVFSKIFTIWSSLSIPIFDRIGLIIFTLIVIFYSICLFVAESFNTADTFDLYFKIFQTYQKIENIVNDPTSSAQSQVI